jgi:hypothetical protein
MEDGGLQGSWWGNAMGQCWARGSGGYQRSRVSVLVLEVRVINPVHSSCYCGGRRGPNRH